MEWKDRQGHHISDGDENNKSLRFLYETKLGGVVLSIFVRKPVSDFVGWFMQRRISALWIKKFLKNSHIDMRQYENRKFKSFNDFFTRQIRPECRPVDLEPTHFISPCDCKLTRIRPLPSRAADTLPNSCSATRSLHRHTPEARCLCSASPWTIITGIAIPTAA